MAQGDFCGVQRARIAPTLAACRASAGSLMLELRTGSSPLRDYLARVYDSLRGNQLAWELALHDVELLVSTPPRYNDPTAVSFLWAPVMRVLRAALFIERWSVVRPILRGVTLHLRPRQMTVILGQPGCGGSALLRLLSGRDAASGGNILINGDLPPSRDRWPCVVSHVATDDIQFTDLTVRQTLDFSCALQLPPGTSDAVRVEYRDIIVKILGIDHRIDTIVGSEMVRGLSGGERRRLSIAAGLCRFGSLYTLDEPTTGLDSGTALRVVKVLRDLCNSGPPVVAVLRQPSIELLALFDQVVVLAKGFVAFAGTVEAGLDFFESLGYEMPPAMGNPADFLANVVEHPEMFAVSPDQPLHSVEQFVEAYRASPLHSAQEAGFESQQQQRRRYARVAAHRMEKLATLAPEVPPWVALERKLHKVQEARKGEYMVHGNPVTTYDPPGLTGEVDDELDLIDFGGRRRAERATQIESAADGGGTTVFVGAGSEPLPADPVVLPLEGTTKPVDKPWNRAWKSVASWWRGKQMARRVGRFTGRLQVGARTRLGISDVYSKEGSPMAPFSKQLAANTKRAFELLYMTRSVLIVKIVVSLIFGAIMGTLFFGLSDDQRDSQTKGSFIFFTVLFFGLSAVDEVEVIMHERTAVYQQLETKMYAPLSYMISIVLRDLPAVIGMVAFFCPLSYFLCGLTVADYGWRFIFFIVILITLSMANTSVIRFAAIISSTSAGANALASLVVFVEAIFCGFMAKPSDIPPWLVWLYWANPASYAFGSAMVNEFSGADLSCRDSELAPPTGYPTQWLPYPAGFQGHQRCPLATGDELLSKSGFPTAYADGVAFWFALLSYWIIFQVLTYLALRYVQIKPRIVSSRPALRYFSPWRWIADRFLSLWNRLPDCFHAAGLDEELQPWKSSCPVDIPPAVVIEWDKLNYSVKGPKRFKVLPGKKLPLLRNVSGYVKPGMMLALMGVTGAGKSTLLDVLAARKTVGKISGSMLINGRPYPRNFHRYVGYCEQRDTHFADQTVREAIRFAALTRLNISSHTGWSIMKRLHYADYVIEKLMLSDVANRRVGWGSGDGITAEQRKRLTLGVELAANPSALFLDEPTSGLDSYGARLVMNHVRHLCTEGRSVVCTIHQPPQDILALFSHLLLLAPGGRMMYFGALHDEPGDLAVLRRYLKSMGRPCPDGINPGDVLLQLNVSDTDVAEHISFNGLATAESSNGADIVVDGAIEELVAASAAPEITAVTTGGDLAEAALDAASPKTATSKSPEDYELAYYRSEMHRNLFLLRRLRGSVYDTIASEIPSLTSLSLRGGYAIPWFLQMPFLVLREYVALYRHPSFLRDRFLLALQFSVILGLLYLRMDFNLSSFGNRVSLLFLSVLYSVLAASPLVGVILAGRPIVFREISSGSYSIFSYAFTAVLWDLPVLWMVSGMFGTIVYWLSRLGDDPENFFYFLAIVLLGSVVMTSMTRLCAFLGANLAVAMALLNLFLTVALLFAGFYEPRSEIPPWYLWLHWLSFGTHMLEALVVNAFRHRLFICDAKSSVTVRIDDILTKDFCPDLYGDIFLSSLGFEDQAYWRAPLVLFGYSLVFLFACLLALRFVKHMKR
jgi:ABC-type multidrug transport system ATPase subunit/ABC-type multidrug transport system permease subunit